MSNGHLQFSGVQRGNVKRSQAVYHPQDSFQFIVFKLVIEPWDLICHAVEKNDSFFVFFSHLIIFPLVTLSTDDIHYTSPENLPRIRAPSKGSTTVVNNLDTEGRWVVRDTRWWKMSCSVGSWRQIHKPIDQLVNGLLFGVLYNLINYFLFEADSFFFYQNCNEIFHQCKEFVESDRFFFHACCDEYSDEKENILSVRI